MLTALKDYAIRENLVVMPGMKSKLVRWLLKFSPDAQFLGVQDLKEGDPKGRGREFAVCPDLTQPEMAAIGSGCRHFLVDGLDVVCLLTKDGTVDDKLTAKHAFFVDLLDRARQSIAELGAIAALLRDDSKLAEIRAALADGKAKPTDAATFAVVSPSATTILVEGDRWHDWWQSERLRLTAKKTVGGARKEADSAALMRCLLSGELVEPMATQNKIERLSDVGGLAMGDCLVSFDKDAFTSYGLAQGENAAMSEMMVKTYSTALNHLIRNQSRKLAGVKVVYWYSHHVDPENDPMLDLFGGEGPQAQAKEQERPAIDAAETAHATSIAGRLLGAYRSGVMRELGGYRYSALTLSANSGRVVIRDWMEGPFEELLESITAWFDHLSIVRRDGADLVLSHKFLAVLAAPLRELRDAPAPLVSTLWRCAVKRQPIPHQIMAQTLNRVRLDVLCGETPLHARIGLLKAFCIRNGGLPQMTAELNELENEPAYLYGRIMALLATIQDHALPGVGAGVVQRYYAAASATPGLVLGRLVRLAQIGHLPKIKQDGIRISLEKQLTEVMSRLCEKPHKTLTLQEQTLFAIGYYQQMAHRYQRKNTESAENAETSTPAG